MARCRQQRQRGSEAEVGAPRVGRVSDSQVAARRALGARRGVIVICVWAWRRAAIRCDGCVDTCASFFPSGTAYTAPAAWTPPSLRARHACPRCLLERGVRGLAFLDSPIYGFTTWSSPRWPRLLQTCCTPTTHHRRAKPTRTLP
eukprot:1352091-Prymnesium_polylepis.1